MSLIREKTASRPRDVVPSLTRSYILIASAILTLGIAMYPTYSAPGHWRFRHGFTHHGYHKYEHRYEPNRPVVGIDLGHAYSRAAIMRNQTIEMITTAQGSPEIPSWGSTWSFDRQLNRSDYYFNLTSRGNDRPIHAKSGWQKVLQQATFDQNVILKEQWPPESYTLWHIKNLTSNQIGEPVLHAVLTVPSNTSDADRQALKHAASLAGLDILRVINAPTAASISHQLDRSPGESKIVVIDLGAEALRVTVSDLDDGVFEVLYGAESSVLGGDAYNQRILDLLIEKTGSADRGAARSELVQEAERIKRGLSGTPLVEVGLGIGVDTGIPRFIMSREQFQSMTQDLVDRSSIEIEQALLSAGLNSTSIDHVVLTGGSSKLPHFKSMVEGLFRENVYQRSDDEPAEAAARGAAVQANILSDPDDYSCCSNLEITLFSIGIETSGGVFEVIVPKNQIIPARKSLVLATPEDQQQPTMIRVYGGNRRLVRDNHKLGEIELPKLAPGSQITVTFEVDADFNLAGAPYI